ncbi:MAG: hypothetical protein H0T89_13960 [Deltaproteobacteria bacterium]|nr:hypothetical protein [Deltaproteobacteria bacterium]
MIEAGDRVKLVGIPPGLRDDEDLQTRSLFEKCLGQTFVVQAYEPATRADGSEYPLFELHVGDVTRLPTLKRRCAGS